jgi:hypothetical protein
MDFCQEKNILGNGLPRCFQAQYNDFTPEHGRPQILFPGEGKILRGEGIGAKTYQFPKKIPKRYISRKC